MTVIASPTKKSDLAKNLNLAVAITQKYSAPFDTRDFLRGSFRLPAALTSTTVTFEGSDALAGTYVPIYDAANAAVSRTVAVARGYKLPDEVFDHPFVKLKFGTDEVAARVVQVTLKRAR